MKTVSHSMQYYKDKEFQIFSTIPGMNELLHAGEESIDQVKEQYPDAVFVLMTASELFSGNRERDAISQHAYTSILRGENISSVRCRYNREIERYLKDHMWDD